MEVLVKLLLNIFDLTVFAYYFNTYKKTKRIPLLVMVLTVVTLAGLWTFINMQQKPMWNLAGLLFSFDLISFLYESRMISRLVMIAAFVGVGFFIGAVWRCSFENHADTLTYAGQYTSLFCICASELRKGKHYLLDV